MTITNKHTHTIMISYTITFSRALLDICLLHLYLSSSFYLALDIVCNKTNDYHPYTQNRFSDLCIFYIDLGVRHNTLRTHYPLLRLFDRPRSHTKQFWRVPYASGNHAISVFCSHLADMFIFPANITANNHAIPPSDQYPISPRYRRG